VANKALDDATKGHIQRQSCGQQTTSSRLLLLLSAICLLLRVSNDKQYVPVALCHLFVVACAEWITLKDINKHSMMRQKDAFNVDHVDVRCRAGPAVQQTTGSHSPSHIQRQP
jgi:hypothetical protein